MSRVWDISAVKALCELPNVFMAEGDQCWVGGEYQKPTGWLSNAPFVKVLKRTCPGAPFHEPHDSLVGFAWLVDGTRVGIT